MGRLAGVVTAAMLLAGCGGAVPAKVDDAWVRLPAVPGRPGAAYFRITGGDAGATLVGVSTPIAARAEMHESMAGQGGMMTMAPLAKVVVAPHATTDFAPGGRHVMLFGLTPAARAGGTGELSFRLSDGRTLTAKARILAAGDPAP